MGGGVLIIGWRSFKSIVNNVLRLLHETTYCTWVFSKHKSPSKVRRAVLLLLSVLGTGFV